MFQKIGAKGEETAGDRGGLSLGPLVHIAQGHTTHHYHIYRAWAPGCGMWVLSGQPAVLSLV